MAVSAMIMAGCGGSSSQTEESADGITEVSWEFDDPAELQDWRYFHQDTATVDQYAVTDGKFGALDPRQYL